MTDEEAFREGHEMAVEWGRVAGTFDKVEAAIVKAITETPIGQEAKVLNLHKALQTVAAVRQAVREMIDNGVIAEVAISQAGLTRTN